MSGWYSVRIEVHGFEMHFRHGIGSGRASSASPGTSFSETAIVRERVNFVKELDVDSFSVGQSWSTARKMDSKMTNISGRDYW
jgi:hypothetical protein